MTMRHLTRNSDALQKDIPLARLIGRVAKLEATDTQDGKPSNELRQARQAMNARADKVLATAAEKSGGDATEIWLAAMDNKLQAAVQVETQMRTESIISGWHDRVFNQGQPGSIEYVPPREMIDFSGAEHPRQREHIWLSDGNKGNHMFVQRQMKIPADRFQGSMFDDGMTDKMLPEMEAVRLKGSRRLLEAATGTTITTGSTNFPDLTTFSGAVEFSRDAYAPVTNPDLFDVWATPGNIAPQEFLQIKGDPDAANLATEGVAITASQPEFQTPLTVFCKVFSADSLLTKWATYDAFINEFPMEIAQTGLKDAHRLLGASLTTGDGDPTATSAKGPAGAAQGVVTAIDRLSAAPWSITSADYSVLKDKSATPADNPFDFADMIAAEELMDEGLQVGNKIFHMANKDFFAQVRKGVYDDDKSAAPRIERAESFTSRVKWLYALMGLDPGVCNSAMEGADYSKGDTTYALYLNGSGIIVRYLPPTIKINSYRASDQRQISCEVDVGGWAAVRYSSSHGGVTASRMRTNP